MKNGRTYNAIFENSSPQRSFRLKKVKYEILILSSDSRYFWSVALKRSFSRLNETFPRTSKVGQRRGIKVPLHSYSDNWPPIHSLSRHLRASRSSFSLPTKLVQLSHQIEAGLPRLAIILLTAIRQESVSNEWAISRCTVHEVKHVKNTP